MSQEERRRRQRDDSSDEDDYDRAREEEVSFFLSFPSYFSHISLISLSFL